MFLIFCGNVGEVAPVSRLIFFMTYRGMLVELHNRNTAPNLAFVGIFLLRNQLPMPHKKLAVLQSLTPMETCNTSQVMLRTKPQVYFLFIIKERLA